MAQILDSLPADDPGVILCCYVNATSKIQVARITNVPDWYFERVVFPGQRLMFEAVVSANLEIHTGMMASAILSDTIPCMRLRVPSGEDQDTEDDVEEAAGIGTPGTAESLSAIASSSSVALGSNKDTKEDPMPAGMLAD